MTEPAQPPAAPAPTPAPPAAAPATDLAAEIARLTKEADDWKGHARTWETRHKAPEVAAGADALAKLTKLQELLGGTAAPDPEQIARELADTRATAQQRAVEVAVLRAAQAAGADGDALLDSRGFLDKVSKLDPNDPAAIKAAVTDAMTANPRLAATPATPTPAAPAAPAARQASTGADFAGSPGGARQLTQADLATMTKPAIAKALKDGLLADLLKS